MIGSSESAVAARPAVAGAARGPPVRSVPLRRERPGCNPVFQNIGAVSGTEELLVEVYRGLGRIPSAVVEVPRPRYADSPGRADGSNHPPSPRLPGNGRRSVSRLLAVYAYASHPFFLVRLIDTEEYV